MYLHHVRADVHHGNGTEETIRWLSPGLETSEIVTPMGFGTLSAPRYKPWHDTNDAGGCPPVRVLPTILYQALL